MNGIIIILGSPNDEQGNLSDIALGRASKGLEEYKKRTSYNILCTGGFGSHFNVTNKPHAEYLRKYLLEQGVPAKDILEPALSHDTVEDATMSKPIVDEYGVKKLVIVTSDFHMERVKHIFQKFYSGYQLEFSASPTSFTEDRYKMLRAHEEQELKKLV